MRSMTFAVCLLLLTACASTPSPENWPTDAPDWQHFVSAYHSDAENRALQTRDQYLTWVRRFYEGRPGVMGWQDTTEALLQDLDPDRLAEARATAHRLGRRIATDWAKDNATRQIDTAMLSLWGSIMVTSEATQDRIAAMHAIDRDTRALLDGDLSARQITEERYAEFDNFF